MAEKMPTTITGVKEELGMYLDMQDDGHILTPDQQVRAAHLVEILDILSGIRLTLERVNEVRDRQGLSRPGKA